MRYSEFKENEILTVDLHKYEVYQAKYYLQKLLSTINPEIKEIIVIHGYHNGTSLMNFVRKDLKSSKIKKRYLSFNPGVTSLIIDSKSHAKGTVAL